MQQTTRAALAVFALSVILGAAQQGPSFTILAGKQFGPIGETTTRSELQRLFPAALRDGDVPIGEGLCTKGTIVLPDTPDAIDVAWQNQDRTRVAFVRTVTAAGRWRTSRGVRIGTTLPDLVRIAGKTLTFSGFGWDYGGRLNWSEADATIGVGLSLTHDDALTKLPGADEIYGDREVRSDHPVVRRARITVSEITVSWGRHAVEYDCG